MVTQSQNTPTFTGTANDSLSDVPIYDPWRYIVGLDGPSDIPGVPRPATTISSVAETTVTDHYSGIASMFASMSTVGTDTSGTTDHLSGIASMLASTISTIASITTGSTGGSGNFSSVHSQNDSHGAPSTDGDSPADVAVDEPGDAVVDQPGPNAIADNVSEQTAWTGTPLVPGWNGALSRVSSPVSLAGSDLEEISPEYQLHRKLLDS